MNAEFDAEHNALPGVSEVSAPRIGRKAGIRRHRTR